MAYYFIVPVTAVLKTDDRNQANDNDVALDGGYVSKLMVQ